MRTLACWLAVFVAGALDRATNAPMPSDEVTHFIASALLVCFALCIAQDMREIVKGRQP